MLDKGVVMLKEEAYLDCGWEKGTRLKKPAGDFNVLMLSEKVVSNKVDGYAVDGGESAFVSRVVRVEEIDDISNSGQCGGGVVSGGEIGEPVRWKDVNVVCSMIVVVRYRALEPAIKVIRS